MIYSLQYLRGIASLLVVLYHARGEINNVYSQQNLGDLLFGNGYIGVDLFFMVSGFVIMLSTKKDGHVLTFILKRIFRIYPVYIACLIFTIFAFDNKFDKNILKAIFLVNENILSDAPWFGYAIVFTAWTLMFEVIFYAFFSISMMISKRFRGLICSVLLAATVFSIGFFENGVITLNGYYAIPINEGQDNYMYALRVLSSPMFIVGIAIYWIYDKLDFMWLRENSTFIMFFSVSAFLLFYISGFNGGHGLSNCGFYSALLLLGLVIYEKYNSVRKSKLMSGLGDISYSLYLIHPIVINLFSAGIIVTSAYSHNHGFSNIYLIIFLSCIVSIILFSTVETPFVRLSRRFIKLIRTNN